MKKLTKTLFIIVVCVLLAITIMSTSVRASGLGDIYTPGSDPTYQEIGGRIIGVVSFICYAAAVIILLYKGVLFMAKAPEAKAEAKKELISYAIGAGILFSAGAIVQLVGNIAMNNLFK